MYLYKSYCYETIEKAADSFYSLGTIEGLGVLSSYSITAVDTVAFTYLPLSQVGKNNPTFSIFSYKYSACTDVGFDNSFFGVTVEDSVMVSWAVVLVLVAAFGFKVVRKIIGW